ncbi:SDR family NAD(P)-dependent oxidoreductase [Nocardioides nitrophenolicus]|uniref:SDR family NAD(P)-dependent oxidoreductase n=1 Tax=Nocardioides nitrophenolicus TaxID=60489 RepID=UPI0019593BD7|nr:SDR family oxidoreductase [Nocardioides nitrophenolicus]MBM7517159.1 NAD(P)-dependent dehydrogenase (short-subunit alcohol dehydrogenase family) [Nocardioides nitrophenolicus]
MAGHVVVTGGASGIGAAVVDQLRERGHAVTVWDLSEPDRDDVGHRRLDVTDADAVATALTAAERERGVVRHLVTSHGIRGAYVPALELDPAGVRRLLDVHVVGTLLTASAVVRRLVELDAASGASVVTLASTTAYGGWANQSDYGVAKAAVRQLTENLAIEWAGLGVRVNAVAPGHTRTPMVQDLIDHGYDVAPVEARTPLGRLCTPAEMAREIVHLLLDATFTTGVCVPVDGGWTAVGK